MWMPAMNWADNSMTWWRILRRMLNNRMIQHRGGIYVCHCHLHPQPITNFSFAFLKLSVTSESIKALLICFSLTGINLFSGTFAMMNYTASIFKASGSDLDPHTSAIIVAIIQIVGVYCSTNLVDRVGRKPLLLFSATGAFFGLMALGTFSYLSTSGLDLSDVNWIPLASFSTFVFISCFGILPLPFIITAEVLPQKVRYLANQLIYLFELTTEIHIQFN